MDIEKKALKREQEARIKADYIATEKSLEISFLNKDIDNRADELVLANKELAFQNEENEKRTDELNIANEELAFQNEEKEKRADELNIANEELAFQNVEKEKRADELVLANKELAFQNEEKEKRADELNIANTELAFQNKEKEKRANELDIANEELAFQNVEKEKRADELVLANKELAFQNEEKEKRADELVLANKELAFQNEEKEKRANELNIANKELAFQNKEKEKRADELVLANTELAFQNEEKEKRANELNIANKELAFQNKEKEKRADELVLANTELAFQNEEKEKRANELVLANTELAFQNEEKEKRADELNIANKELAFQNEEKEKRADELVLANTELAFQNEEKEKRADELVLANTELAFQNEEKEKRADELNIANTELAFQNEEKEKRADELVLANTELAFQNKEKEKRADELVLANTELAFQNKEKEKRANELAIAKKELAFQKELDGYRSKMEHVARDLTRLIDTANAPIFGIDSGGLVNEWNQTSEKITGFKKGDVFGKNLVQTYITEDYRESVKKVLDDALKGKETANFEFPLFTKNGHRVMVLLNSSTRRDANGKITGVIGVGQDITELASYRKELELMVDERTRELHEALKKEKELSELKSKFVSTASHEFRTPLSAINFAAGSIKKYWTKMEPIMIEKKLDKIEDQVMHMTKLLDDILIVGQADAGKLKNNPRHINFGNFIYEIIEEVYSSHKKSHEILLIDNEGLKKSDLFIDEKLGRNIFINLISNAIKYSPRNKKVHIELASKKNHIIISIIDYGIGIPESEFKNIFQPFTRGQNVDLIQGTGLGLSIAKEAIEVIGGKIIVNSTIGSGTSFVVKIPKRTK
ncbi:PAS domain-containing sensor histidine kinase [Polaribacter sp. SA4-10]|uniref:ATP-binding protein n=1 Tax=Polaribacter sp. SA4-10 TaxID=754397 RepID=UPI000B3C675D|nr:ATP-binding protein [Polaribacter sp. SA4-10]ARV07522.1 PAS domain-containing sensor histidine kinase [Polaribacter sp. SA4-10]